MDNEADVIVIGAGAAGLAAAAALGRGGRRVLVLEARDRVGGRILTRFDPAVGAPIELGAEFIHGRPRVTLERLDAARVATMDVAGSRWRRQGGALRPGGDLFGELRRGLAAIPRPEHDLAFSEFLDGPARGALSAEVREFARGLVEGFDAADISRASAFDTLDEWSGGGGADAPAFRPLGGYASLVDALVRAQDPDAVHVRLGAVVEHVRWRRGAVSIAGMQHGEAFVADAPRAVVTLPLGVLAAPPGAPGAVAFTPRLDAKRGALDGLASGAVCKVVLRFDRAFWEELEGGRFRDAAFFHAQDAEFPTIWTALPLRVPLLTAWAGGPTATAICARGGASAIAAALASVGSLLGDDGVVRDSLEAAYVHDWQSDPFARGAYSYVTVGGSAAHEALAAPLDDTLFFAGEATDTSGHSATVAGALASGRRAATQVLRARDA